MGIDITSVTSTIIALLGGGVIGVVIKALIEKTKINAEANSTNIKSLLEIDQRMNERMARLEERVADLEKENYKLKSEKLSLEKESHKLKSKIVDLEEENKRLLEENTELKTIIDIMNKKEEK